MQQIPNKPLASRGRFPSDIDGDERRVKCDYCGCSVWESEAIHEWKPFWGAMTMCGRCAADNRDLETE